MSCYLRGGSSWVHRDSSPNFVLLRIQGHKGSSGPASEPPASPQPCLLARGPGLTWGNRPPHCPPPGSRTWKARGRTCKAHACGQGALGLLPGRPGSCGRSICRAALDEPRLASPRRGGGAMRLRTESPHHMCPVPVRASVESRVREAAARSGAEPQVGGGDGGSVRDRIEGLESRVPLTSHGEEAEKQERRQCQG